MKLSEIFSSLLSAEEQSAENISAAKNEAERLQRKSRESFEKNYKAALASAHAKADALVEAAEQRADKEALDIMNAGKSERKIIIELFESNVNELMSFLANEFAKACVAHSHGKTFLRHKEKLSVM